MGVIVVGVDHSDGAKAALRFALEEAKLRHASLRAVQAWQFPNFGYAGFEGAMPATPSEVDDVRAAAAGALEATLREVIPDPGDLDIEHRVVEDTAAAALVRESRDAELLVVGSRGLGGFRGLLLGSVGQQVAHHSACPVVIVPHERNG
jgi:nucleotide-binding universal stress UspA family protein